MASKLSAPTVFILTVLLGSTSVLAQTATQNTDGRFLSQAPESARVSEWIGETVYASEAEDAETVGEINDLVVSKDGGIAAALIGVGGFLGVGEKEVAVSFESLKFVSREGDDSYVVLETSKDELEGAPSFDRQTIVAQSTNDDAAQPAMGNSAVDRAVPAEMSEADCEAEWAVADADGNGELNDAEKERYLAASRVADHPVATDVVLTREVFLENCAAGYFTTASAPEPGAPFEGANSFTEGQARDRILAAGYSEVSALSLDDKGIWRGTARSKDGEVSIAVDFKGNVVPGNR